MSGHSKIYVNCPKKLEARFQTIIAAYRRIFQGSLPARKQYWTLCSLQVDKDGNLMIGSELEQLLGAQLISEGQFRGVDREQATIKLNKAHLPSCRWLSGDLYKVLSRYRGLNPGVVNCDLLEGPKSGAFLVGNVLALLTRRRIKNVMVVVNFILKSRFSEDVGVDAIIEQLNSTPNFRHSYATGKWKVYGSNRVYCYEGTGNRSRTRMGSIIFYRKA